MENPQTIFETIIGSYAYGTLLDGVSDIDKKFVYVQHPDNILGFKYLNQIEVNKDYVGYEIKRFIELLAVGNPTTMEMLFTPKDCVEVMRKPFELLIENRYKFLTKDCKDSFAGFAFQQIKRSKGHNKKINMNHDQVKRKDVLDFCYVHTLSDHGLPLKQYLADHNLDQRNCGLVSINHMPNMYSAYYSETIPYKGIVVEDSNHVRLSSIPKGEEPIFQFYFNKDAYSIHCKEFREYETWVKNRNEARFVETIQHGQHIDGKNLLHATRLLDVTLEFLQTGELNVRRPNAQYLIEIRQGKHKLEDIILRAEEKQLEIEEAYLKCTLPEKVDPEFVHNLLIEIRHQTKWTY